MLIDSHCHLEYLDNPDEAIAQAKTSGIEIIVNPTVNAESAEKVLNLAKKHVGIYVALGIYPEEAARDWPSQAKAIEKLLAEKGKQVVAIGETGLDFADAQAKNQQEAQLQLFKQHLEWAKQYQLPLVIHNRKASNEILDLVEAANLQIAPGVLHCFTGSKKFAKRALEMGFYLGIGGLLTYETGLQEVVKTIPLDRIVLETDSPYLVPEPVRQEKRYPNEPANLIYTAQKLAELKQLSLEEVAAQTTQNVNLLFSLEGKY
ncbi:TatD family hydrolase [Candidatus Beckwithbacteria bacterium]|nr:TatD family hydrolase [Candidatus Beckwithbacteria bacterium]